MRMYGMKDAMKSLQSHISGDSREELQAALTSAAGADDEISVAEAKSFLAAANITLSDAEVNTLGAWIELLAGNGDGKVQVEEAVEVFAALQDANLDDIL